MFTKILVPLDRSTLAEQAIGRAAAIARQCQAELDLVLVHESLLPGGPIHAEHAEMGADIDRRYLEAIASELMSGASIPVTFAAMNGSPAEAITRRAQDEHADLIVMTSHGRTGLSRAWLGSVADGVMRQSAVPVLMLRPIAAPHDRRARQEAFNHVLVPLDGSANAAEVLPTALALAHANRAKVSLLRVVPPLPALVALDPAMPAAFGPIIPDEVATRELVHDVRGHLEATAHRLRERSGVETIAHVRVAEQVADEIVDFAISEAADVIAMSTQGRGASRLLIGSVADKVLRSSGLPVLLRRATRSREDEERTVPLAASTDSPATRRTPGESRAPFDGR